ncbi:MAG: glycosyltransferase [Eubacteriales bacterium]|nr:glycosyltransferase [Eubacteriales bacterium]
MKILIAVPTFETIFPDTYKSIWNLDKGGHEVAFDFVRGYDCATARNRIAQKAIDGSYDYVLMVDNDVVLPPDVLVNMLDDPVDVCLGYYAHRNSDNRYTGRVSACRLKGPDGGIYYNYPLESEYTAQEMNQLRTEGKKKIEIHGGGMGCALIRVDVFRRIRYPWYDWVNYDDGNRGMLSEDLYFCERCKDKRINVYTDTRAGCGHLLRYVQRPE